LKKLEISKTDGTKEKKKFEEEQIILAEQAVIKCLEREIPYPIFGPAFDGNIEIEWQDRRIMVTLDSNLKFKIEKLDTEGQDKENLILEQFIKEIKKFF